MYYRKDLLAKAGFAEKDMQNITWDRYIEIGKKVVKPPLARKCSALTPMTTGLVRVMMQSAGRWYFDKDGKLDIKNNPALKAALETQAKLFKAASSSQTAGWAEYVGRCEQGRRGLDHHRRVWITGSVKAEKSQSGHVGVAPTPSLGSRFGQRVQPGRFQLVRAIERQGESGGDRLPE
jgi:lactose/L-arabinose transport system substrate-binding protein